MVSGLAWLDCTKPMTHIFTSAGKEESTFCSRSSTWSGQRRGVTEMHHTHNAEERRDVAEMHHSHQPELQCLEHREGRIRSDEPLDWCSCWFVAWFPGCTEPAISLLLVILGRDARAGINSSLEAPADQLRLSSMSVGKIIQHSAAMFFGFLL